MNVVSLFHDRLATTVLLFFVVAGVWGLVEFARGGQLGGNIAGMLIIGQVLVVVQGALGMVLFVFDNRPTTSCTCCTDSPPSWCCRSCGPTYGTRRRARDCSSTAWLRCLSLGWRSGG